MYTQRAEKVFRLSQKVSQCAKVGHIQDTRSITGTNYQGNMNVDRGITSMQIL